MLKTSLIILSGHEAFPHQYDENTLFPFTKEGKIGYLSDVMPLSQ